MPNAPSYTLPYLAFYNAFSAFLTILQINLRAFHSYSQLHLHFTYINIYILSNMAFPWIYPVRVVQALFGVIVIGLTGYGPSLQYKIPSIKKTNKSLVVSTFYYEWSYSDTVNFLLFLGCWTAFVAVPYLTIAPIWFPRLAHHYVIPAVEVITMIFWFAGFIAMGAMLPPPRWCHGSACSSLQAATVFGAFEW